MDNSPSSTRQLLFVAHHRKSPEERGKRLSDHSNLEELFKRIALRFLQPRQCQTLLTAVLTENGRIVDPVHSKGYAASCDTELKRAMTFQTVILECLAMKEYYEEMYSGEVAQIAPWLGQGMFTPDFLGVMKLCAPHQEMIDLAAELQ